MSKLLNPIEVADRLGLTIGALAQMRYEGRGPAYIKLSAKQVRYREDVLEAWLDAQTRVGTAA